MQRDLGAMSQKTYDLLVIGGGITGAAVAWDAALRGLAVALVDKADFGGATSGATSKLIHGGLRYLKTMEVGLVRESLQERRIMELIAPHLVYPLPFVFPAYGWGMRGLPAASAAMVFYDTLSYDRRWINDDDKKIPSHTKYSREEILELEPGLEADDLKGGVIYYDCQMYSPERLTLEFILSAAEYGAEVANYAQVEDFLLEGDTLRGARVVDLLSGRAYELSARLTMNAAGPWADLMLAKLRGRASKGMIRSKGIHLLTRPIHKEHAIVLQTRGGRHFFILPWRGKSLIGTTDDKYQGHPDDCRVTTADIDAFLTEVNETYPSARLTPGDVLFFYGGLRPIVEKETSIEVEVYDASRKYELYDHEKDEGLKGLITAIGGKYTTSRNMARQVVDLVMDKLDLPPVACTTHTTPLAGGEIGRYASFVARAWRHQLAGLDEQAVANLCRNYGSRYPAVIEVARGRKGLLQRIGEPFPDIASEVIYAVRCEMAHRLSDIVFRRTGLGTLGNPGEALIEKVADLASSELKWKNSRRNKEIDAVLAAFVPCEHLP